MCANPATLANHHGLGVPDLVTASRMTLDGNDGERRCGAVTKRPDRVVGSFNAVQYRGAQQHRLGHGDVERILQRTQRRLRGAATAGKPAGAVRNNQHDRIRSVGNRCHRVFVIDLLVRRATRLRDERPPAEVGADVIGSSCAVEHDDVHTHFSTGVLHHGQ